MSFARAAPIALLLALAAPAVAHADATITVTGSAPNKTLTFTVNDVLEHHTGATADDHLVIDDTGALAVGASGCALTTVQSVDCGPAADFENVVFDFGPADDRLVLYGNFQIDVAAEGGAGNDTLNGASGDDELVGGDGDDHLGGSSGVDVLDGGNGDDLIAASEFPPVADVAIACGQGLDAIIADDVDDFADDCEIADPPSLDGELQITGDAREGSALGLALPQNSGGEGVATFGWARCDASGEDCLDIGAIGSTYTPTRRDVGSRLRAWYRVENVLGADELVSEATAVVAARPVPARQPRPPRPPRPRPPTRSLHPPYLVIPPLAVTRKPYFTVRNGDPVIDTGRAVTCPGVAGGAACRLKVATVPTRATAHIHGRPSSLGQGSVLVAAATRARVRVPLNLRAYRLLRARRKLTLLVTVTVTRPYSATVKTTFTITVKLPKRR